jgi:hypothetical protein
LRRAFAFAGGHFGDFTLVQGDATDELQVERDHFPGQRVFAHHHVGLALSQAAAGVLYDGERFGENFVQHGGQLSLVLDWRQARLPVSGLLAEIIVGKAAQAGLNLVDFGNERAQPFDFAVVLRTDDFFENEPNHVLPKEIEGNATGTQANRQIYTGATRTE